MTSSLSLLLTFSSFRASFQDALFFVGTAKAIHTLNHSLIGT